MNIRERVLSHPAVYKTFKRVVLPGGVLERLVSDHFVVDDGGRVLDLGCGFGDYAPFYAERCDYLGIDHNESYIETARRMNAGSPARFLVADVADPVVAENGPFDLVMMSGVLHHLPSDAVRELAALIRPLISANGRFVAMEPVFDPDQGLTARLTIAADRGRFARDEEGYRTLLETAFAKVDTTIVSGMLRIPYTHVILTAAG
ncbi:MAG: class I SAM-dependent methyltransferase [Ilumatobacteraceae bacterium]